MFVVNKLLRDKFGSSMCFAGEGDGVGAGTPGSSVGAPAGGTGAPGGGGGDGTPPVGDGDKGQPDDKGGDAPVKSKDPDFVTPTRLTQVLDARGRKADAAYKKLEAQNNELRSSMAKMQEMIAKIGEGSPKPDKKGEDGKDKEDPEKVELRRAVDELKRKFETAESRAEEQTKLRRNETFKRKVIDALVEAGCTKPEAAFRVIQPDLKSDEEVTRVFATVKSDYGEEDLDVSDYIRRVVAEDELPELFKGKMRAGSPAGGDAGSGGGAYVFTKEEILEHPELYAKDPEKARAAIEQGRVKGVKPRGQN